MPKSEFEKNAFDHSINRYKGIVHEEEQYDYPKVILGRLKKLEAEIAIDLEELEKMLGRIKSMELNHRGPRKLRVFCACLSSVNLCALCGQLLR